MYVPRTRVCCESTIVNEFPTNAVNIVHSEKKRACCNRLAAGVYKIILTYIILISPYIILYYNIFINDNSSRRYGDGKTATAVIIYHATYTYANGAGFEAKGVFQRTIICLQTTKRDSICNKKTHNVLWRAMTLYILLFDYHGEAG